MIEHNFLKHKTAKYIGFSAILIMIAVFTFYAGIAVGQSGKSSISITEGKTQNEIIIDGEIVNLKPFWEAWTIIRERHIDGEKPTNRELMESATQGLVSGVNDPYTVFMKPEDSTKFQEDVRGEFGGVGMELETKNQMITVVAPLANTPAEKAGIQPGDIIAKVDGFNLIENRTNINEAVKMIRGEVGQEVTLTVHRQGTPPFDIVIERDIIKIPTLEWEMLDGNIAHIKLMSFNQNSLSLFHDAAVKSTFSGSRGMILDLRNNPGGYLEVATQLAGWFVRNGEIVVSEQFRSGAIRHFRASGNEALRNFPVVVLINKGSASASEILAGAIRDLKGAPLVGESTFGKGTIQELETLSDGSMVKVTIAYWVLPNGHILKEEGLEPEYLIEMTEEDREEERDPQLEKAIEVLNSQIR